ncbi:hypothetical protein K474DRAFT_1665357 [Panus rudis PR-1116 ss-1]|nr:hypothetical protein K474DRAFT_1665357 [Panus rudis PR-1116 ss-1]
MIEICRAEDGHVFQVNATFRDIEASGSLETFLGTETGVEPDAILAYASDGTRLRNENVRELAGIPDQRIYVFNKTYLDLDLDQVLERVHIEPALQPPIQDTKSPQPYLTTTHTHTSQITHLLNTLRTQHAALLIASSTLDLHVLHIHEAFSALEESAVKELDGQERLLRGVEADLVVVGRVGVSRVFLSGSAAKRTLGDYVSRAKMKQVVEACARTHENLRNRYFETQESMTALREGADEVRERVNDVQPIEEAEASQHRAREILDRVVEVGGMLEKSGSDTAKLLQELRELDSALRAEVVRITDIKNEYTTQLIHTLRQISQLNDSLIAFPSMLTQLQTLLRQRTSFGHLQRLHGMVYAYGATVVEVVRRREFVDFFLQRAQSILDVMAKLSQSEKKRRQLYRSEVHGQLPFQTPGMDDDKVPVPEIDYTPTRPPEGAGYDLGREDVDELLRTLDDIETYVHSNMNISQEDQEAAIATVREARAGIERLIAKMDGLESGFERIAERSLLSSSRLMNHRRRNAEVDEQAYAELEQHIGELQHAKAEQEESFQREKRAYERELAELRAQLADSDAARKQLERDLNATRAQLDSETNSRRILEMRNAELSREADAQRASLATALAEATERTRAAEVLRQQLDQVRSEFEDVKALESRNAANMANLLEEQANALRRLEEARSRGEDLEAQIRSAREESDEVKRALAEAAKEKDRLLRAQASEHDRLMRDHIAEADGDRAVLEHQYLELKAALEDAERQLKDVRGKLDMANSDVLGLREELQRVEHELRDARLVERVLRDDLRAGRASQSDYEIRLERSARLVAEILDVALRFRESHLKALSAAQAMVAHPISSRAVAASTTTGGGTASLTESSFGLRRGGGGAFGGHALLEEPEPIDPSDPAAALEILRTFDHDQFLEAIHKAGSTIRKWQKQCKEYRERAKGKISFRNFAKGDLALFLPTRNSVSKPWAAFNVSFPHYFLQATGHLAEQLKTREWIVARITSITERVVDHKDASTNPYGLGDGVKYYMLEVEDWTQPSQQASKRRTSNRKISNPEPSTSPPAEVPPPPPEADVEESFTVTRPPNSRLFPSPPRANSLPLAGPSSLSRLLAQATPETTSVPSSVGEPVKSSEEASSASTTVTPFSPQPPPSPSKSALTAATASPQNGAGSRSPSTLRPGSRASRQSASSRFSSGRIPFAGASGAAKATATTALSEQVLTANSPSSAGSLNTNTPPSMKGPESGSYSPSPEGSPTEGMTSMLQHRRSVSHVVQRVSPLKGTAFPSSGSTSTAGSGAGTSPPGAGLPSGMTARSRLASLASSWGVAFSRKRLSEAASGSNNVLPSPSRDAVDSHPEDDSAQSPSSS